jgi:hypothetical protein
MAHEYNSKKCRECADFQLYSHDEDYGLCMKRGRGAEERHGSMPCNKEGGKESESEVHRKVGQGGGILR